MVDRICIHEDDWGMRSLHPLAARVGIEEYIAEAAAWDAAAAARSDEPAGIGDAEPPATRLPAPGYAEVGLLVSDADRVLSPIMPRVRKFSATIISMVESDERDPMGSCDDDAWCFGTGWDCYVKLEVEDALVTDICFDFDVEDADSASRIRKAIMAIDSLVPSMIADHRINFTGPVSEPGVVERYFAQLEEVCRRVSQARIERQAEHGGPE